MSLRGQVALVTGGASGLGLAIVRRFVADGASVVVLDKSRAGLDCLSGEFGDAVIGVEGDVRAAASHHEAVSRALEAFGGLDCAIGNAGVWDYGKSLVDLPEDRLDAAFDEIFHINVKGYLLLAKAAAAALVASEGSLIFTISNAGFYPGGGGPLYTATKHAIVGLVRQLAYELAPWVRVNGVAPGGIQSDLRGLAALGTQDTSISALDLDAFARRTLPLGRTPGADAYAGAYAFFADRSTAAAATGALLNIDGGVGVRGLVAPAGGVDLKARFGREQEREA